MERREGETFDEYVLRITSVWTSSLFFFGFSIFTKTFERSRIVGVDARAVGGGVVMMDSAEKREKEREEPTSNSQRSEMSAPLVPKSNNFGSDHSIVSVNFRPLSSAVCPPTVCRVV